MLHIMENLHRGYPVKKEIADEILSRTQVIEWFNRLSMSLVYGKLR